ncbi:MAG: Bifunctional protein FolD protein [Syntrophomonadaceae bacterium]|nr:Bifunctional protein FolD protein [Bacillota bacterium]
MIIDGKKIAAEIIEELKKRPKPKKFFGAFLVGDNLELISFLKQKEKVAKEIGIDFRIYRLTKSIDQDELRKEVLKIAQHKTCGGVIVQLPPPERINAQYVLNAIPREKDVDVLGERALGAFYAGRNPVLPPAVGVVDKIIQNLKFKIQNSTVAVIGLGFLVGEPIATWLQGKCLEIYLLDEGSDFSILKQADLVITGVGKPGLIEPSMLKDGAGVIDFGYGIRDGKICGDFNTELPITSYQLLRFYTETPGGTGPILVAKLFENFYKLNE